MSQRQALVKLLDVLSQQIAVALIAQSWVNGSFQLFLVGRLKAFPHIALDHPAVRIIPFLHGAVRQTEFPSTLLVSGLSFEKIVPHLLFHHVHAVVLPLSGLCGKGVERNGLDQRRIDYVVCQVALYDLVAERRSVDSPCLRLVDHERVQTGGKIALVDLPCDPLQIFGLATLENGFCLFAPFSSSGLLVCFI